MIPALRAGRSSAAALLSFGVVVAATGWLYVLRPSASLPGPRFADALALDELSHRGSVSVPLFLAAWLAAALLLGLIGRWARAERLIAGLLLGFGVAGWLYALNGVSILAVRQISAHEAFHAAAAEQSVVVPAVLAGIAGALLGRPGSGRARSPQVIAWFVAAVGVLAVVDALFPEHRRSLVTAFDAAHVHGLSKALVAPLACALVVTARSLARGNRRAWHVALLLLALLLALHIERRFDDGAIVTGIAVVALVACRGDFRSRGDPSIQPRVLLLLVLLGTGIAGYGIVTIWINRLMADRPYTVPFALAVTARALAGLSLRGSDHLSGPVANWFPLSTFLLGTGSLAFVLLTWVAPWRYRVRRETNELAVVRSLVAGCGSDTLAPFALRADKSYYLTEDESAFLAYRVVGGVAIVAGDPIGRADARVGLVQSFLDFAHERGWRVAVLGVSEDCLPLYESLGLRSLYHGEEAVVETAWFSLEGRSIRKVRQSCHRLAAAGFAARVLQPSDLDAAMRREFEEIAQEWRGDAPERGFVMALDDLFSLGDGDAVFVVGFDADGGPQGLLHFAVSQPGSALSLSSMPRRRTVPNGFNEWLICEAIGWARASGLARVSLNFSPFAALLSPEADLAALQRLQAATLQRLKGRFQLDNLLLFNRKFQPSWQARFLVYERRRDLPRVGLAALAAEAYLPFQ